MLYDELHDELRQQMLKNTVDCSAGNFEEHPRGYKPRVFITTESDTPPRSVELLETGNGLDWSRVPDPVTCGFDYWLIKITPGKTALANCNMVRHK